MWQRLAAGFGDRPVDLLVLPELAGVDSFWSSPTYDEAVWRQAAATHATLDDHLRRIAAKRVVGTANRRGATLAGGSWIVAPDGDILARTDESIPVISLDIDLALVDNARLTYPRNVRD